MSYLAKNPQHRIDNGLKNGTVTQAQAARDEPHDANVAKRESGAEAKPDGRLTKKAQRTSTAAGMATACESASGSTHARRSPAWSG